MSLYTTELRRVLKEVPCKAVGLMYDFIEYEDHMTLCLYRDNFGRLSERMQGYVANEFVPAVMAKSWEMNTPLYLEVRNES